VTRKKYELIATDEDDDTYEIKKNIFHKFITSFLMYDDGVALAPSLLNECFSHRRVFLFLLNYELQ
jgi:hypothetical protein